MGTRTLLDHNRSTLDGTNCSSVHVPSAQSRVGYVGRIINFRIGHDDFTAVQEDRPWKIIFTNRSDNDPISNSSLLNIIDDDQEDDFRTSLD